LLVALFSLSACHRQAPGQSTVGGEQRAFIVFNNESLAQADVYAIANGISARRIGTVMAGRTENLVVPPEITMRGSFRLVARLLASSNVPGSGTVGISPGERLSVRLPLDERTLVVLPAS
jgi:hypothetical protein